MATSPSAALSPAGVRSSLGSWWGAQSTPEERLTAAVAAAIGDGSGRGDPLPPFAFGGRAGDTFHVFPWDTQRRACFGTSAARGSGVRLRRDHSPTDLHAQFRVLAAVLAACEFLDAGATPWCGGVYYNTSCQRKQLFHLKAFLPAETYLRTAVPLLRGLSDAFRGGPPDAIERDRRDFAAGRARALAAYAEREAEDNFARRALELVPRAAGGAGRGVPLAPPVRAPAARDAVRLLRPRDADLARLGSVVAAERPLRLDLLAPAPGDAGRLSAALGAFEAAVSALLGDGGRGAAAAAPAAPAAGGADGPVWFAVGLVPRAGGACHLVARADEEAFARALEAGGGIGRDALASLRRSSAYAPPVRRYHEDRAPRGGRGRGGGGGARSGGRTPGPPSGGA